jgi:hypothetical protein
MPSFQSAFLKHCCSGFVVVSGAGVNPGPITKLPQPDKIEVKIKLTDIFIKLQKKQIERIYFHK